MKTAEEKAKEIVDGLPFAVAAHRARLEWAITMALKEQDRDTRHACAEAVLFCSVPKGASWKDVTRDACINVKAV